MFWLKFRAYNEKNEYLLHQSYIDGKNSLDSETVKKQIKLLLPVIFFLTLKDFVKNWALSKSFKHDYPVSSTFEIYSDRLKWIVENKYDYMLFNL